MSVAREARSASILRLVRASEDVRLAEAGAEALLARLRAMGSKRNREGMSRFGIDATNAYGVSAARIKRLAREAGRDHRLAAALWRTGVREARHLASMIEEPEQVAEAQLERWARDFDSWDIVDGTTRYLILFTPFAWRKAAEWSRRREEFVRRAGFALMAWLAVHDKRAPDAKFLRLLPLVRRGAADERNFVKKAVNWALRQIGKRSLRLNRAAIAEARRIRRLDSSTARWVAADALRELTSPAVRRRLRRK